MSVLRRWDLWLFVACAALFLAWPGLDLAVSGLFYDPANGFYLANHPLVQLPYQVFAKLHFFVAGLLVLLLLANRYAPRLKPRFPPRAVAYLLIVLVLGPGLLVNWALKTHVDRARPHQVVEFGGEKRFTPALTVSDQCERNCSFVSGHAAMGFYWLALAWVTGKRRWLWIGLAVGVIVGGGRVIQGGHFLSDIVFAFWAVYLTALLTARLYLRRTAIRLALAPAAA